MEHLEKKTKNLAPKGDEEIMHRIQWRTTSIIKKEEEEEEAMYDMAVLVLTKLRHQKELEEMAKSLTLKEHEALSALELLKQHVKKKRTSVETDDSEETLRNMLDWKVNTPDNPPSKIFVNDLDALGECSKPLRKQLMGSDVLDDQCRLMLGKDPVNKMMVDVLGKAEKPGTTGINISVYGPDGEAHQMVFKMWNKDTPVLASKGWMKFVKKYDLEALHDFLTVWMFKHKLTRKICFAIDSTRFRVKGKLSNRILKAAF